MDTRSRLAFVAVLFGSVAGCGRGPDGNELAAQVRSILSDSGLECAVDVNFEGIGEGDADSAYATIQLEEGLADGRRSRNVEVLVSRTESRTWKINEQGSNQIIAKARELCGD